MTVRVFDFLIGAGILQGFFLAAYLWFGKKPASTANRILAGLVAAFAVNLTHTFLRTSVIPLLGWTSMEPIEPFQLLLGPLLFLFLHRRVDGARLNRRTFWHFLPFVIVLLALALFSALRTPFVRLIFWGFLFLQISGYFGVCFVRVRAYNHSMTGYFSKIEKRNMNWLNVFMVTLLVLYLGYLLLFVNIFHGNNPQDVERILSFLQSMAVFGIGTFALFFDKSEAPLIGSKSGPTYRKSALSAEGMTDLKMKLSDVMTEKKPFLNSDLTLPQLAQAAGIPRNTLSQVINEGFGKNFYDYINGYRVEEVIRLMGLTKHHEDKLLTLAFDAGFNSKPAFNVAFRKVTGKAPSTYRKEQK